MAMKLKHGTKIEVRNYPLDGSIAYEAATIMTRGVPKAWGTLPNGYHRVKFANGGCICVHEDGFRLAAAA